MDPITGTTLAVHILGPIFKEIMKALSPKDMEFVDDYMDTISDVFDRLDPAVRTAVAAELQESLSTIATDPVRWEYIGLIRKRIEYLKAKKSTEKAEIANLNSPQIPALKKPFTGGSGSGMGNAAVSRRPLSPASVPYDPTGIADYLNAISAHKRPPSRPLSSGQVPDRRWSRTELGPEGKDPNQEIYTQGEESAKGRTTK